jgi:phosphoribosylformimino-5-aminoimidazole carboxamide ribotide isomerase
MALRKGDTERSEAAAGSGHGGFVVLPAIDLVGGRVVRLVRGDFNAETAYGDDPVAVASGFADAGARWLHVVDLDGARDPAGRQSSLVAEIVRTVGERSRVEVAGGLRDESSVEEVLGAGAARVVIGTAALRDPGFAGRLVHRFGADRVAAALDVRNGSAVGQGWLPGSASVPVGDALARLADAGVVTFEVTAIDRDGTLAGPDLDLLARLAAGGRGEFIASAGIRSVGDLCDVARIGCAGAIVGRALYEGRLSIGDALRAVPAAWERPV